MTQVAHKKRREWPLAALFSWRFSLVSLVPIILISMTFIFYIVPRIKQDVEDRHVSFVTSVVSQAESYFSSASRELGNLSRLIASGNNTPSKIEQLLDAYVTGSDIYESIYLVDAAGHIVSIGLPVAARSMRANQLGLDISGRGFFKESRRTGTLVWSNSFLSLVSGRLAVAVAVPFGELTLVGEIATAPLPALVRKLAEHTNIEIMLLDRDDQLVAHSRDNFSNQQMNLGGLSIVRESRLKLFSGTLPFDFSGEQMVGAARVLPGLGWLVVVAESRRSAFSRINIFWMQASASIGFALLAAMGAAILAARMLSRLFQPYNQHAQAIADGNYNLRHIDSGTVELNLIGENLQRMALAIQERESSMKVAQRELQDLNLTLEDRVVSRTVEMARAREAAETASRAKSVFLANMSHELRTPLNAILGFAKLLERDSELSQESRKKIATINRSGLHLLALINDVLEISRIEADRVIVQKQAFDLIDMVSGIEEMIKVRAEEKGLAFLIEHAADLPLYVEGDGAHLKQILINLLSNAVKYTPRGHVLFRVDRDGHNSGSICFVIADTGRGISADEQKMLFNTFYQTESAIAQGEGTGLGLAISMQYAKLMGGRLEVKSEIDQGSVFTLTMPLPETQGKVVVTSHNQTILGLEPGQNAVRILVVDDKEDNRELLRLLLEATGFEVRTADDGQQAVAAFQSWQPHLIWIDMRMPVMDGYEATRLIRGLPGGALVKIVALTASAFEEDRVAIMEAGCDGMVSKPVEEQRLFATMGELLGLRYRYDELVAAKSSVESIEFDLTVLPLEIQLQLKIAADALDFSATQLLVEQISKDYPDISAALDGMLQSFHFDRISQLCRASDETK
jgi:signal transduction histidine kinase/DNA-binding response OmpR family regulator